MVTQAQTFKVKLVQSDSTPRKLIGDFVTSAQCAVQQTVRRQRQCGSAPDITKVQFYGVELVLKVS